MIIAFTGKAGSGKNTAASMVNYIVNGYTFDEWLGRDQSELALTNALLRPNQYKNKDYRYINEEDLLSKLRSYVNEGNLKYFFEEKSFASKVKDVCSILTGIPREDWDKRELRDVELPIEGLKDVWVWEGPMHPYGKLNNYTYRTFMQRIGTEAMREMIHKDIWVNALMVDYKDQRYKSNPDTDFYKIPVMNKGEDKPLYLIG